MRKTVQIDSELKKEYSKQKFSDKSLIRFEHFFSILSQWNQKINLTAIRDPEQMIIKHLHDSLAICRTEAGEALLSSSAATVMDIGSGAGIPGILLQIVNPSLCLHSIDKSKKKIGFQEFVKAQLNLPNLHPVSERIEDLIKSGTLEKSMDFIVSRAFDQIKDLFKYSLFFLSPSGSIILWKGKGWQDELDRVPAHLYQKLELIETCDYQLDADLYGGTILVFKRSNAPGI